MLKLILWNLVLRKRSYKNVQAKYKLKVSMDSIENFFKH